jgi:transcriptional regulator with XRE-family HTH domain
MARRPVPKKLAKKLALIRMRLGLSQTELVEALKYKATPLYPAQISNFEQGKREPPLMVLLAYARLAGVSVESLIDDKIILGHEDIAI